MTKRQDRGHPMKPSDLDDICPAIGYTATRVVAAWFGGKHLRVPVHHVETHPLAELLGASAARALIREFPGVILRVPCADDEWRYYRNRVVAERLAEGHDPRMISADLNISVRRLEQIRLELIEMGWIRFAGGYDGPSRRGPARGPLPPPTLITHTPATADANAA